MVLKAYPLDIKATGLVNARQKPVEPYEEFLARLSEAIGYMVCTPESAQLIIK